MFQNIKVDIIYYKSNTDFEMEFNLCGCCRMRLLTDKSPDKKSLVHSLARAVSRSKVIIIAGNLFGDDGIINIVSNAIGKTLSEVNNKLYGISGDDKISVISGATPLVTSDGYFGGCIIESGPQSMILLSDNKTVRKSIMNTLIHPYIEELCALDLKAKADLSSAKPVSQAEIPVPVEIPPVSENMEDIDIMSSSQPDSVSDEQTEEIFEEETVSDSEETEIFSESAPETAEENTDNSESPTEQTGKTTDINAAADDGVALSGGMIFETDDYRAAAEDHSAEDNDADLYVEPQKLKKGRVDYYNEQYAKNSDEGNYYHSDEYLPGKPRAGFSGNLPILIVSIILLVVLAVLCYCIFYVPAKDGISASAYLQETFNTLFGH